MRFDAIFFLCFWIYSFPRDFLLAIDGYQIKQTTVLLLFHYFSLLRFYPSVPCWMLDQKLIRNQSVTMVSQKLECLNHKLQKLLLAYHFYSIFTDFILNQSKFRCQCVYVCVYRTVRLDLVGNLFIIEFDSKPTKVFQPIPKMVKFANSSG